MKFNLITTSILGATLLGSLNSSLVHAKDMRNLVIYTGGGDFQVEEQDIINSLTVVAGGMNDSVDTVNVVPDANTLNQYDSVYDIRFGVVLTEEEQAVYEEYINANIGTLYLQGHNGVRYGMDRQNSINSFIESVGGGIVTTDRVGSVEGADTQYSDLDYPKNVSIISLSNSPGVFTSLGNAHLITYTQDRASGSVIEFTHRSLGEGKGTLRVGAYAKLFANTSPVLVKSNRTLF